MSYVKNNKVFLFLFIILTLIIALLVYQMIKPEDENAFSFNENEPSKVAQISNFYGQFLDDQASVNLSWSIHRGRKHVKEIILFCDDERIKDVSDLHSYKVSLEENGLSTGNHKFDITVTFTDETSLTKTLYVYVDEAYHTSITSQNMKDKSVYTFTYTFDKRRSVNIPILRYTGGSTSFEVNFIASEKVAENGDKVTMKAIYELYYNDARRGDYLLNFIFSFPEYNLDIDDYTASFRVATGDDIIE